MKKLGLTIAVVLAFGASANAADMKMPLKAPPAPAVVSPWDFAFGAALTNDYRFRGIAQSNRQPSVSAYFEPRYNVNDSLQLYAGFGGASISFPNRAAAEIDVYGGIRPTFGAFAFDFGVFGYLYPGGQCFNPAAFPGSGIPGSNLECVTNGFIPVNGNVIKKDLSFVEGYAKVLYTINDQWAIGANYNYTPSFLNSGAQGNWVSGTVKWTAPANALPMGLGMYVSGEFGRQFLGRSDAFYGVVSPLGNFAAGINYADYNTWNAGIGFTYKVATLDLRYSGTDLNRGNCNAFTSDHRATFRAPLGDVTPINPGGFGSTWCGHAFVARFSVDVVASQHLK